MILFSFTFPILALVLLSYRRRRKGDRVGIGFVLWIVSYQFAFIGLLGIGLIQVHLDCQSVLGDCYVEGYPRWLETFKFVAGLYLLAWSGLAIRRLLKNIAAEQV
jgi:hypothetical protein